MLSTFVLVTLGWVFFRSETLGDAVLFFKRMLFGFTHGEYFHPSGYRMMDYYVLLIGFAIFEYIIRKDERNPIGFKNRFVRFLTYLVLILLMIMFYDDGVDRSFIYFQF